MSTKVYTGVLIDFENDFWKKLDQIQQVFENTFNDLNKKYTDDLLFEKYKNCVTDVFANKDPEFGSGILIKALEQHKENKKDNPDPLASRLVVFETQSQGKNLGFVSGKGKYFENLVERLDFVDEYGYWNNTDKPDELSDEDWDERRNNWNEIFDKNLWFTRNSYSISIPETEMRTFHLLSTSSTVDDLVINENRLRSLVQKLVLDSFDFSSFKSPSTVISVIMDANDVVLSKELNDLPLSKTFSINYEILLSDDVNKIPKLDVDTEKLDKLIDEVIENTKENVQRKK